MSTNIMKFNMKDIPKESLEKMQSSFLKFSKDETFALLRQEIASRVLHLRKSGGSASEIVGGINELMDLDEMLACGFYRSLSFELNNRVKTQESSDPAKKLKAEEKHKAFKDLVLKTNRS